MPRVLEKKERSLGTKLSIRGERCESPKCALIRKPYRPGQHGKSFSKMSEFGTQLKEKQKIKFSYGVTDKQLRKVFAEGAKSDDAIATITGLLERRLDNVVMRLGFVPSRSVGRQMTSHGHFLVNGQRVKTPSYQVSVNDIITIRDAAKSHQIFEELEDKLKGYEPPVWLTIDKAKLEGKVESLPHGVEFPFNINLVVDYYSKK